MEHPKIRLLKKMLKNYAKGWGRKRRARKKELRRAIKRVQRNYKGMEFIPLGTWNLTVNRKENHGD